MTPHFSACKEVFSGYTVWGTVCFSPVPQNTLRNRVISANNLDYPNGIFVVFHGSQKFLLKCFFPPFLKKSGTIQNSKIQYNSCSSLSLAHMESLVQRTLAICTIHNFRNKMLTCAEKIKNYLKMTTSFMTHNCKGLFV